MGAAGRLSRLRSSHQPSATVDTQKPASRHREGTRPAYPRRPSTNDRSEVMTRIASAILGAILTTAAIPAAASAQGLPVQAVTYADLDLASAAGRQSLDRRVGAAVRRVCGRAWPLDLGAVEEVRRCRADT